MRENTSQNQDILLPQSTLPKFPASVSMALAAFPPGTRPPEYPVPIQFQGFRPGWQDEE